VEAISDALRLEVRPFGVHVILIEPGLIRTDFGDTAARILSQSNQAGGTYAQLTRRMHQRMTTSYASKLVASGPESVAAVIERALTSARPRARYVVTPAAHAAVNLRRFLPDRVFDAVVRTQFPLR
jgi:short-subunit dehydrogenase